jgi:hypothetical protein
MHQCLCFSSSKVKFETLVPELTTNTLMQIIINLIRVTTYSTVL